MNKISFKSIRTRLTSWFLFLALIPLLVVLVLTYFQRVHAIEEQTIDKLTAIRNLKVQQLTRWIDERSGDLKVISGDFETRELENIFEKKSKSPQDLEKIEEVRELFKRFHRNYNDYKELFFIDAHTGLIEISTNQEYVGANKSHNLLYTEPLSTGDIFIKDIHKSSTTNQIEMTFSIPVLGMTYNKDIIGVLVLRIDLEHFLYDLLGNKVGLGETGETLIVNNDVVALNELRWYENAPLNLIIDAEAAVYAAQGKTGITETTDYRGEKILAAYTYIPQTKWGFVCKQDLYELHTPIRKMLINFVIIFLLSGIVISFFTLLQSKSISKPIIQMNEVAKKMQDGDYSIRNPIISKDELGSLAAAFNNMADATESRLDIQQYVTDISETMITQSSMQDFGSALLKILMNITNANMCTFYILNEATSQYEHFASIGANQELLRSFDAVNPEGEFGNAVSEKKIIYLNNISNETIFRYRTTAGDLIPKEIITIPVIIDKAVVALISLACLNKFKADTYDVLQQSMIGISTSYSNLLASERTRILAEHLSQINQQLEAQTEELQEQSEEMQSQTEELQHTTEELQEQNLELDMQRKQVEEANRLKSEFLSNMSHELRTPLNSIMALSRVLIMQAKDKLSTEENSYLEIVERNGKQLLSLINDILDLSKIEAGKMEMYPTVFSLNGMLTNIKDSLQPLAKGKDLNFTLDIAESLPQIETDEAKLRQILQNIVGNAVKFTETGGVDINVNHDFENIKIVVKDTGIGILTESLPYIFEEFRQVDGTSSRPYEGTGLGLAIAAKLVKALNGDLYAESELGNGSTFTITIPIKWHTITELQNTIISKPGNISKEIFSPTTKLSNKNDKTILVIDDNPQFIEHISKYLEIAGYYTISTTSGKEALSLAEKHHPFAITLDVVMPEMDGWEVLQELKRNNKTNDIPVIVVSISVDRETGFAMGAIGFIQKPIDKTLLVSEIKKLHDCPDMIMIVDDNDFDRVNMSEFIKAENINTIMASNGKECIDLLKENIPDVLVLDLVMPEMNGFQVLSEIRKTKKTKDLPIIIVTAKDLNTEESKLLSGKVSSVLSKSESTPVELYHEIKRILAELEEIAQKPDKKDLAPRILIVEDNESVIIQLQAILKEKYNVNVAKGGKQALDFVSHTIPDGIILDLMMPDVDGFEVLENIRNKDETREIPVLILTAKDLTKDDLAKLSANNIQQLVQKGDVDITELMHKIKLMFEPAGKPKKIDITEIGDVHQKAKVRKKKIVGLPKVLIVEDNPDSMITIKAILGNKYALLEAEDGEKGLNKIVNEKPDLVLLDISLPEMDGFEVLKNVKKSEELKDIPLIAVTARAMIEEKKVILAAGFDDYVSKPIDNKKLLKAIEKWLGKE
jgi:CheY-like chemotaxis protein/HAMP domain-containing protein